MGQEGKGVEGKILTSKTGWDIDSVKTAEVSRAFQIHRLEELTIGM